MKVLLVNPPIYDFTAYDFWLRPYGMLRVAGLMRHQCDLGFFDFLISSPRDAWGRGWFESCEVAKPECLKDIPRRFRRFGRRRSEFRAFLQSESFDAVLVQTTMTYWYPGIKEVIEDVRLLQPAAKIVIGGIYATLCADHARSLDVDLVVEGSDLAPLWRLLSIEPKSEVAFWPAQKAKVGVIKITEGCPLRCTYCSAPLLWREFSIRPTAACLHELQQMISAGLSNIAFYDDALLFRAEEALTPFLEKVIQCRLPVQFHTPNALHARFMSPELARLMIKAGFRSFYFGLESGSEQWQRSTGGKVYPEEFAAAVECTRRAGAEYIASYVIVGHPDSDDQQLQYSIRFAHQCGTRVILSEFSPIPGTIDGVRSEKWVDPKEPLSHNKTAFTIRRLGVDYLDKLKKLSRSLNAQLNISIK